MKQLIRPTLVVVIILLITFLSVMLSGFKPIQSEKLALYNNAAFVYQTTATPQPENDNSEIGSTDGITVMSFAIVAIIIIPIVLKRKNWSQT